LHLLKTVSYNLVFTEKAVAVYTIFKFQDFNQLIKIAETHMTKYENEALVE
jgi:hypothetical protein